METGSSILNYKGDAGKALGSSRDVTVIGGSDTTQLGQTARELALSSFAANQQLFRQRIADRDAIYKMIEDDKLNPGAILEEDRPLVDAAKKQLLDSFYENGGDIMTDTKKYREFVSKFDNAKAVATQAQKRYLGVNADLQEKQKFPNPVDQSKIDEHVKQQIGKGFWGIYDPFAPISHFNLDVVAKKPIYGQVEVIHSGDEDISRQKVDPNATFNEYQKQWAQPTQTHWFNEYVNQFLTGPNAQADVARINAGIDRLNEKTGSNVEHLKVLSDRPDQIAAKIALADSDPVVEKKEFAKDRVNAQIDKGRLAEQIRNNKANNAIDWAKVNLDKKYKDFLMENGGSKTSSSLRDESLTWAQGKINEMAALGVKQKDGGVIITPDKINRLDPQLVEMISGIHVDADGKKVAANNDVKIEEGKDAIYISPTGKIRKVPAGAYKQYDGQFNFDNAKTVELPDVMGIAYNYLKDKSTFLKGTQLGAAANIDTEGETGPQYNQKGSTKTNQVLKGSYTNTVTGKPISLTDLHKSGYSDKKIQEYIDNGILK